MTSHSAQAHSSLVLSILWIARISSALSILFLGFMIFGHLFGDEPQQFNSSAELVSLLFFPIGLLAGLLIAFKSETLGGAIACLSMLAFFVLRPDTLGSLWMLSLAVPGVLFLIFGLMKHKH